ncbi:MAG TPA: hypothetical protein VL651_00970, partial [Bacteroidia bacterium]|nr:hypothetical protein [Bacteroidia bacterium]
MSWIIYLLLFLLMVFLIMRSRFFHLPGLHRSFPLLFFIVKVIASFAVWWIYTHHYPDRKTADIWKYFDDGNVMYSSLKDHPGDYFRMLSGIGDDVPSVGKYYHEMDHWYQQFDNHLLNDAHFMIRLNAVFRIFSLGNYHIHSLLFCFLAFIGLCALFKTFYAFLSEWKFALAAIIFFFPSLVFWTSGVLKESIMIFALGIFLYQLFKFRDDRKILRAIPVLFSILLLFLTKFYLLAALAPATIGLMLTWKYPSRALLKFSVILLACITGAL